MVTRTDTVHAHDLSYPMRADQKGYARKCFENRFYYFGQHNTPESFALFGEWRRRLIESGEAPDVKALKAEIRKRPPTDEPTTSSWRIHAAYAAACVLICIISGVSGAMLSTSPTTSADELPTSLTDVEQEVVDGIRRSNDRLSKGHANDSDWDGTEHPDWKGTDWIANRTAALLRDLDDGKDASKEDGS